MTRAFAVASGVVFLLIGGLGSGAGSASPFDAMSYWIPATAALSSIYLWLGTAGIASGVVGGPAPLAYARCLGAVLLLFGVVGVFAPTTIGLESLGDADFALHVLAGTAAVWVGTAAANQPVPQPSKGRRAP